jgi:hypothetical protein
MKPPHCGVGQSDGLLVIAHGRPHVYIRAATQKPRQAPKAPELGFLRQCALFVAPC